ncbi:MAG: hypothetical protein Q8911_12420 [Bacillota bacterium]|nr:hypothetical protein [Bacillota bacterium]
MGCQKCIECGLYIEEQTGEKLCYALKRKLETADLNRFWDCFTIFP